MILNGLWNLDKKTLHSEDYKNGKSVEEQERMMRKIFNRTKTAYVLCSSILLVTFLLLSFKILLESDVCYSCFENYLSKEVNNPNLERYVVLEYNQEVPKELFQRSSSLSADTLSGTIPNTTTTIVINSKTKSGNVEDGQFVPEKNIAFENMQHDNVSGSIIVKESIVLVDEGNSKLSKVTRIPHAIENSSLSFGTNSLPSSNVTETVKDKAYEKSSIISLVDSLVFPPTPFMHLNKPAVIIKAKAHLESSHNSPILPSDFNSTENIKSTKTDLDSVSKPDLKRGKTLVSKTGNKIMSITERTVATGGRNVSKGIPEVTEKLQLSHLSKDSKNVSPLGIELRGFLMNPTREEIYRTSSEQESGVKESHNNNSRNLKNEQMIKSSSNKHHSLSQFLSQLLINFPPKIPVRESIPERKNDQANITTHSAISSNLENHRVSEPFQTQMLEKSEKDSENKKMPSDFEVVSQTYPGFVNIPKNYPRTHVEFKAHDRVSEKEPSHLKILEKREGESKNKKMQSDFKIISKLLQTYENKYS